MSNGNKLEIKDSTGEGHFIEITDARTVEGYRVLELHIGLIRCYASGSRGYEYETEYGDIWLDEAEVLKLYEYLKVWCMK